MKLPHHALLTACLAALVSSPSCAAASAAETAALLAPVNAWVSAFNNWEATYPSAAFTEDAVVIDQFPPFLWHGKHSARAWWTDLMGASKEQHERERSMQQHVEFAAPQFVQIKGGRAYFVQLGTLTWVAKDGTHEMKATWVATEKKTPQGWRIASHAWAPLSETVTAAPSQTSPAPG